MRMKHTQGPGKHGYCKGGKPPHEYWIWATMIQRCHNPRCREYPRYGGRGIAVCDRWREAQGFVNFLADVGPRPSPRASLNRIDNDGPYAPENVRWSTQREQKRNCRDNRVLTHGGRSMPLAAWAEEKGMGPATLWQRLSRGWDLEAALTEPVEPRKPYEQWLPRNPNPRRRGRKPGHGAAARSSFRAAPSASRTAR